MRMRPDLTATQQRYQGRLYWVVKEPVGLHYFRFQEEEYGILKMLDGHSSLDDMKERFEQQFPPQKITVEELGQFVGMLHRSGLVITDAPGQGVQLKKRRDERKRQELLSALSNILAIRFKGIDPDRLLTWLYPKMSWMYGRLAVTCCTLLGLAALMLVLVNFDTFQTKLPTFHQFFTAGNWIYLGVTLGVTKVIHEFGHGLTCKHFGGECHEMGVMFLVLTPCLYCNVSDSWMLPNKWHRAWIGAAGMYIELVIASICTFVWWFSEPGMLNQLCLSTMFVCSVSTVMFNANPLLRYDGYYILSDLIEIPNLRQKATTILNSKLAWWCLGLEEPDDPFLPQRNQVFFAIYSVAAAIYRWVVLFSIFWFLYQVFEPYGLKVVSQMIATASIAGLIIQPLWKLGKFFYVPGRLDQVKRTHVRISLAVVGGVLAFVCTIPLPHHVFCLLEIKPRDAEMVYVDVPGRLEEVERQVGPVGACRRRFGPAHQSGRRTGHRRSGRQARAVQSSADEPAACRQQRRNGRRRNSARPRIVGHGRRATERKTAGPAAAGIGRAGRRHRAAPRPIRRTRPSRRGSSKPGRARPSTATTWGPRSPTARCSARSAIRPSGRPTC